MSSAVAPRRARFIYSSRVLFGRGESPVGMDFGELSVEPSTPLRLDPEQGRGVEAIQAATVPTLTRRQTASSGRFAHYSCL
jgi:hypothetical protein